MFVDRTEAGRRLAERLDHLRGEDVVVVGLPRGGVPVAAEVARALHAPLDVIVVRKLGVPFQPELAMGAIGEGGARVVSPDIIALAGVSEAELERVEDRERDELERRARVFRAGREPIPLAGRVVVVVDDGMATGATARVACQVARAQGARRVVLAVPVAPRGAERRVRDDADEFVCVDMPRGFGGVGQFYLDFRQTRDEEVTACLHAAAVHDPPTHQRDVELHVGGASVGGRLSIPGDARGIVLFAHGSGSSRHSPRNRYVASVLNAAGLATLLFDLLTGEEELRRANVFDIDLLAGRLRDGSRWVQDQPELQGLEVSYFGASTGAAAALVAAAAPDAEITAVVSRGGRPDLAGASLPAVRAPTLLIVGGADTAVLALNRDAQAQMRCECRLEVVPGATHLFEEPGALPAAAELARDWFLAHLRARQGGQPRF